jgi:signal transduction histidine kinase
MARALRVRVRRRTARTRLTLLYSGMFLLLGTVVVVIVFALTSTARVVSVSTATPGKIYDVEAGARKLVVPEVVHQQHNADVARLVTASWLVLLLTALASTVLGWFIAGRVLRPLRVMTDTANTISAHNLGERLALTGPDDEFKRLGDTFDGLLARLQAAFEAQRRFVANAAHELRTPLTVDRTLLQVALANPHASAEQLRATCEELLASSREQERLLEALLTLATTERGLDHSEPVDLAALAARVAAGLGASTAELSLAPAPTSGDGALIELLVVNLLDNAIRHNDERAFVRVATGIDGDEAFVEVENSGPTVLVSTVARLFEPFERTVARPSVALDGHHGFGLSIVRAVAGAHAARVHAQPRDGGGLRVRVAFKRSGGEA